MKAFVKVDMEGVTGVVDPEQLYPGGPEYAFGRRMMMHDLCAVLDGILSVEGAEAVVYDMHARGRNVDLERLPPGVSVLCGRPTFEDDFCFGLDESFDALFLVGARLPPAPSVPLWAHLSLHVPTPTLHEPYTSATRTRHEPCTGSTRTRRVLSGSARHHVRPVHC